MGSTLSTLVRQRSTSAAVALAIVGWYFYLRRANDALAQQAERTSQRKLAAEIKRATDALEATWRRKFEDLASQHSMAQDIARMQQTIQRERADLEAESRVKQLRAKEAEHAVVLKELAIKHALAMLAVKESEHKAKMALREHRLTSRMELINPPVKQIASAPEPTASEEQQPNVTEHQSLAEPSEYFKAVKDPPKAAGNTVLPCPLPAGCRTHFFL